ncbi:hypothetical protein LINPERHAP2_LOCUS39718 [Linum perenne]
MRSNSEDFNIIKFTAKIWSIWRARNEFIFRGTIPSLASSTRFACQLEADWRSVGPSTDHELSTPQRPQPNPPPVSGHLQEIMCDGSFSHESALAGYGVIIKDSHGRFVNGCAGAFPASSPIVAEARAMLEAVRLAVVSGQPSRIKSDCLTLVDALRHPNSSWPWQCNVWLLLIQDLLQRNPRIDIAFIPRRLNFQADWIAKRAANQNLSPNWTSNFNSLFQHNVSATATL